MSQNLLLAFVPLANLKRLHGKLKAIGLGGAGGRDRRRDDLFQAHIPANLALTKSMNLGDALGERW